MSYSEQYTKIEFENEPSHKTPLEADILNQLDDGIKNNDIRITEIGNSAITGFANSDTINWLVTDGQARATIKEHGITDEMIEEEYLANITEQATKANQGVTTAVSKATESKSWAVGGTNSREGEDTNNAKYWSEQARIGVTGNYVSYDEQTLTDEQKAQARANIGAISGSHTHTKSDITDFPTEMPPTAHNHDDRYYTKTEIDGMLGTQATWVLDGTTLTITTK